MEVLPFFNELLRKRRENMETEGVGEPLPEAAGNVRGLPDGSVTTCPLLSVSGVTLLKSAQTVSINK